MKTIMMMSYWTMTKTGTNNVIEDRKKKATHLLRCRLTPRSRAISTSTLAARSAASTIMVLSHSCAGVDSRYWKPVIR